MDVDLQRNVVVIRGNNNGRVVPLIGAERLLSLREGDRQWCPGAFLQCDRNRETSRQGDGIPVRTTQRGKRIQHPLAIDIHQKRKLRKHHIMSLTLRLNYHNLLLA